MKIKSINPLIVTSAPEDMLPLYVKTMGFTITHNLEFPKVNLLVLENGDNRVDIVVDADPKKKRLFPIEYYAIRINVDNYDKALQELLDAGCKVYLKTVELKSARFCLLKQPNGLLIGLMKHRESHKKTTVKKVAEKKTTKKVTAK